MALLLNELTVSSAAHDSAAGFDLAVGFKVSSLFSSALTLLLKESPALFSGSKHLGNTDTTVAWRLLAAPVVTLLSAEDIERQLNAAYKAAAGQAPQGDVQGLLRSAAQAGLKLASCPFQLTVDVGSGAKAAHLDVRLELEATVLLSISHENAVVITPVTASLTDGARKALDEAVRTRFKADADPYRDLLFFLIDAAVLPMVMQKIQDKLVFPIPALSYQGLELTSPQLTVTPDRKHFVVSARAVGARPALAAPGAPRSLKDLNLPDRDAVVLASRGFLNRAAAAGAQTINGLTRKSRGSLNGLPYDSTVGLHIEHLDVLLTKDGAAWNAKLADGAAGFRVKGSFYAHGEVTVHTRHLAVTLAFVTDVIEDLPFKIALNVVNGQVVLDASLDFQPKLKFQWRRPEALEAVVADHLSWRDQLEQRLTRKLVAALNAYVYERIVLDTLPLVPLDEIGGVPYAVGVRELDLKSEAECLTVAANLDMAVRIPTVALQRYRTAVDFGHGQFQTYAIGPSAPDGVGWVLDETGPGFAAPQQGAGVVDVKRYFLSFRDGDAFAHRRHYYGGLSHNRHNPEVKDVDLAGEEVEAKRYSKGGEEVFDPVFETPFRAYDSPRAGALPVHLVVRHVGKKKNKKSEAKPPVVTNLVAEPDLKAWTKEGWLDGGVVFHAPKPG